MHSLVRTYSLRFTGRGPAHTSDASGTVWSGERKAALIAGQREKPAMASLGQEHRYGLSCGKNNRGSPSRTLYHVKLTDTAIRALEAYQNLKVPFPPVCLCVCLCACARVREMNSYFHLLKLSPPLSFSLAVAFS